MIHLSQERRGCVNGQEEKEKIYVDPKEKEKIVEEPKEKKKM